MLVRVDVAASESGVLVVTLSHHPAGASGTCTNCGRSPLPVLSDSYIGPSIVACSCHTLPGGGSLACGNYG